MAADQLTSWLLDSNPALRWQVERDVLGEPRAVWEQTRAQIATEGFGARLLALQDPDGQWAGGAFFPADFDFHGPEAAESGQPWTATTWTLNSLREWGLDPDVLRERRAAELLAENAHWEYDDLPYWGGEVDCCINAWTLANGVWLALISRASRIGSSNTGYRMAGRTASGSRGPIRRRFTQRSTPSRDYSPTTPRRAAPLPRALPGERVRSISSSAT